MSTATFLKNFSMAAIGAAAVAMGTVGSAQATTLTFDDIPQAQAVGQISNGYGGLNWNNFYYINGSSVHPGSGYDKGTVSGTNTAFNAYANPATVSISSGTFDFNNAYLTAAWIDGNEISVEGLFNGESKYSKTVAVNTQNPTKFDFNFLGINQLKFKSSKQHFALDNFTFNQPVAACGAKLETVD